MAENENEEIFLDSLTEEDFLDIAEEATEDILLSDTRREMCYEALSKVQKSYIQLIGLNRAIEVFLKTSDVQKLQKTSAKIKKRTHAEDNSVYLMTCKEQLLSKIPKLEKEIQEDERAASLNLNQSSVNGFTLENAQVLAGAIPESLGRTDYNLMVSRFGEKHASNLEVLTLEEKKVLLKRLQSILFYCNNQSRETDSDNANKSDTSEKYFNHNIPIFDVTERLKELIPTVKRFETAIDFGDDVPVIYSISKIEKITDTYQGKEFYRITLNVLFSSQADVPDTKVIFRPVTFDNQMHIIGISNLRIPSITATLAEVTSNFVPKVCDEFNVPKIEDDSSIIRVPYYITGIDDSGFKYIAIGEEESPFCTKELEETKVKDYPNYLAFLQEAVTKRTAGKDTSIWYSSITVSPTVTPQIINTEQITSFQEGEQARYSGEDLFQIAKSKNAKKHILSYYDTKKGKLVDENFSPTDLQSAMNYVNVDTSILKQCKSLNDDLKFKYDDTLTSNRNIIMQTIMQFINKPIHSRLDVENIFENNKTPIMKIVLPQLFNKIPYDREMVGLVLGAGVAKDTFYDYIASKKYKADPTFKINLKLVNILDSIAFMYRLRLRGFCSQNFLSGNIQKVIPSATDKNVKDITDYTNEEFVEEVIQINREPINLLDLWGVIPDVGANITKTSSAYHNILTALVESYQVYSLLIASDKLSSVITAASDITTQREEEDMTSLKYNKSLAPTAKYNGYEAVKDLGLSESFYNKYRRYLTAVINNFYLSKKSISTDFDGGMIVNAYIRAISDLMKTNKSLEYKLFYSRNGLKNNESVSEERWGDLVDDLESNPSTTLDTVLESMQITNMMDETSKGLLEDLFTKVIGIINISRVPMLELLMHIESLAINNIITTVTELNISNYIVRLGFDSKSESPVSFDVKIEAEDYSPNNVKESIEDGKNLYVTRDITLLTTILGSRDFNKWVSYVDNLSSGNGGTWDEANDKIYNAIVTKMKPYDQKKVDRYIEMIVNKVSEFVNTEVLKSSLEAYINLISPTEIDSTLLFVYINKQIADLISSKQDILNLKRIKLEHVDVEVIASLEKELFEVTRKNNFIMMLSPFLPVADILTSNENLQTVNQKVFELLNNSEEEVYLDPKVAKKNAILYRKYLKTGDTKYCEGVDIDTIPFELLTLDIPTEYKLRGPYSMHDLIYDYSLVDIKDEGAVLEAINAPYIDLFELVLEQYPDFYKDCPRAIRQYITQCKAKSFG